MGSEQLRSEERLNRTPDSVFVLAHLITAGGIGDLVALSTVAARLRRAGISRVGLGYKNIETHFQVASLVRSGTIDFQPLPEELFDPELSLRERFRGYRDSITFQRLLMSDYERIALLGASEVRFLKKSPLRFRLDVFPKDVYFEDQRLIDNYASQLGRHYGIAEQLDHKPVEFLIPTQHTMAVKSWAKANNFVLSAPFWVINLSTGRPEKTWPLERFNALSQWFQEKTEASVVFMNPPGGFNQLQASIKLLRRPPRSFLFASAEIGESMDLIQKAAGYIGGDTGLTHIAAALGTPLVVIYPEVNLPVWKPVTAGQEMLIVSGETIKKITPEHVIRTLEAQLNLQFTPADRREEELQAPGGH